MKLSFQSKVGKLVINPFSDNVANNFGNYGWLACDTEKDLPGCTVFGGEATPRCRYPGCLLLPQGIVANFPAEDANLGEGTLLSARLAMKTTDLRGDVTAAYRLDLLFEGAEVLSFYSDSNNVGWAGGDVIFAYEFDAQALRNSAGTGKVNNFVLGLIRDPRYVSIVGATFVCLKVVFWQSGSPTCAVYMHTAKVDSYVSWCTETIDTSLYKTPTDWNATLGYPLSRSPGEDRTYVIPTTVQLPGQEDSDKIESKIKEDVVKEIDGRYTAI